MQPQAAPTPNKAIRKARTVAQSVNAFQCADAERATLVARMLAGARMVIGSEIKDGQRLDVAKVKAALDVGWMTTRSLHPATVRELVKLKAPTQGEAT